MTSFQLELNPLWLVLFALIAGGFSFFLYRKHKASWPSWFNKVFSVVRFVFVFLVLFLLAEPYIKGLTNTFEKPQINVIIDNSSSVGTVSKNELLSVYDQLDSLSKGFNDDYNFNFFSLSNEIKNKDSLSINHNTTNLSETLKWVDQATSGSNSVASILVTDGIVNQGVYLEGINSSNDLFCIGVGDTTEKKDVQVKELFVNKSTFLGNEFPIHASILAKGYSDKVAQVSLFVNSQLKATKTIKFSSDAAFEEIVFKHTSSKKGFLNITVKVDELKEEQTTKNNVKSSFVKVNESKQKIAFVSRNPHPDIKAIVSSLKKMEKDEVEVFNLSYGKKKPKIADYDIFILHQLPCARCGNNELIKQILTSKKSRWIINGNNTGFREFNAYNKTIKLNRVRGLDKVGVSLNEDFDLFELQSLDLSWLQYSPPLSVPYGEYISSPESHVLLYQKVGTTVSNKPLMIYKETQGVKEVVLLGEGLWNWKMTENLEKSNHENFDLLISKTMGLLDQNRKEDQFITTVMSDQYNTSQEPRFSFVSKNQLGELVYNNEINLKIISNNNEVGNYNFQIAQNNNFYSSPQLDTGVYRFVSSTVIGGKKFKDAGIFSVEDIQLESKSLQADFDGLRSLTEKNNGDFYFSNQIKQVFTTIQSKGYKKSVTSNKTKNTFVESYWLLLLVLLLATGEWVSRKAFGEV